MRSGCGRPGAGTFVRSADGVRGVRPGTSIQANRPAVRAEDGNRVTLVLGSTGTLAQQIRNGAPADVFFAANESFITELAAENLTLRQTHALYARGRVADGDPEIERPSGRRPGGSGDARVRRIAIANPQHAPYGLAAQQALEAAGLWTDRGTEARVRRERSAGRAVRPQRIGRRGLVARSVADTSDLTWTLVDERLHAPLDQMAVVLARTKQPDASMSFIEFVNGTQGRRRDAAIRLPPAGRVVLMQEPRAARGEGAPQAKRRGAGRGAPATKHGSGFPSGCRFASRCWRRSLTVVAGVPLAWLLARRRFPGRDRDQRRAPQPAGAAADGARVLPADAHRRARRDRPHARSMEHRARVHVAGRGAGCRCRLVSAAHQDGAVRVRIRRSAARAGGRKRWATPS